MQSSTGVSSGVRLRRLAFAALAVVAIVLAGREVARQWTAFRASGASLTVRWSTLTLSAACVLAAYALLIETWRRLVASWGAHLPWGQAARIWFISNLGRYLPGKVWQIGAMAVMAQQRGVSAIAATGSAIVVNLVNLLTGFVVVGIFGASLFQQPAIGWGLATALAASLVALPRVLPALGKLASRVSGRTIAVPDLPVSSLWVAAGGCTVAWILYGVAFQLLARSVLGDVPGATGLWIAAFTGSYLLGYIALFSPGGLGVREGSLIFALQRLQLASGGGAGVLALASRLWLTVLEVLPGLVLLGFDALRRHDEKR